MVKVSKVKEEMTTIQVRKATTKKLQALAKWGDTYDVVIDRLLNGNKPEERGEPQGDE